MNSLNEEANLAKKNFGKVNKQRQNAGSVTGRSSKLKVPIN